MISIVLRRIAPLLLVIFPATPAVHASCGASFCTLNTGWESQGASNNPGTRIDLRYEYIDQEQVRAGQKKISPGDIPKHHDEIRTLNRNLVATVDYAPDTDVGVSVQLPFVKRYHRHIHNHQGAKLDEAWNLDGMGDVRIIGRRRLGESDITRGVLIGVKLPTGSTSETNSDGDRAERTLQPGSGTTDLILGMYANAHRAFRGAPIRYFGQLQAQGPVNSSEDFRSGNRYSVDLGVAYPAQGAWSGLLQLNASIHARDRGRESERKDSGGNFVWLSPGLSYAIDEGTQLYGFVQLPLYQHVHGVQLTANWTATAGVSLRF